jgi:hypothetical protein
MRASEELSAAGSTHPYYRTLLLEMETGTNNITDTMAKINGYNRLIRTNREAWLSAYGASPRVLVVVPTDQSIEAEALKWRLRYHYKQETALLLTSLQTLARVYGGLSVPNHGDGGESVWRRRALLTQACWLDVMAGRWKTLGEALDLA